MAFLHSGLCACLKSELSLFSIPPTQTTIENSNYVQYKPISSLADGSPIEFSIPGTSEYIDLAHTLLSLSVTIKLNVKPPEDIEAETLKNVGPINNFMHSIFNQVDVFFNQKPVSPPNNAYAYRSYIETLLSYGSVAKKSHLTSVLWYNDTAGGMDDTGAENKGLVNRRNVIGNEKTIDMVGNLHCDVFNQNRLLLNGVEVRVRLLRSKDAFCLMDPTGFYTVKINEAALYVRRVKLSPSIILAHEKTLSQTTAKYPLTRVEVKTMTMHSGVHSESLDNVILGQLPKRIIIGFVENKAFNGDKSLNPFNFKNFKINYLCLYIDGVQVPSKPLQPDFTKKKFVCRCISYIIFWYRSTLFGRW